MIRIFVFLCSSLALHGCQTPARVTGNSPSEQASARDINWDAFDKCDGSETEPNASKVCIQYFKLRDVTVGNNGIIGIIVRQLKVNENSLNKLYEKDKISFGLVSRFQDQQAAWVAYRNALCQYRVEGYTTEAGLGYLRCAASETARRQGELLEFLSEAQGFNPYIKNGPAPLFPLGR